LQQGSRFILSWFRTKEFLNHVKNCGIRTSKVGKGQRDLNWGERWSWGVRRHQEPRPTGPTNQPLGVTSIVVPSTSIYYPINIFSLIFRNGEYNYHN
jgi:hypothetical protein